MEHLPIAGVPDDQASLFAARGQAPAVGAERHAVGRAHDLTPVSLMFEKLLACRRIPNSDRSVRARRGQALAIAMERHAEYIVRMTAKGPDLLAGLHVEDSYCAVSTSGGEALTVRAKRHAVDAQLLAPDRNRLDPAK